MYYSIMLNIKEKKVVVIGGGNIAFRKTKRLLESGGRVSIISPELNDRFLEIRDKINYIQDKYKREYIKDAFIVIGATHCKDKNREIGIDCENLNILYNNVDNCENSSFITPAIIDKEGLLLAVSSKGRFPAICKYVKKDLENRYDRFDEEYVNLLERLRALVLDKYYKKRIKIFYHALELNLEDLKILYNKLMKNEIESLKYIDGGCKMKVVVGTRGSDLAVTQTNHIIDMLKEKNPNVEFQVKKIKTKGDLILDKPIGEIGGKEIFIKEIQKELLEGSIDMAVHSMKDMPGELPEGLKLSYIPKREDHRDVIVLRSGINSIEELPKGAKIGTGSKRRKFQMLKYRDDLEIIGIRGNVQTRIDRIDSEGLDGVILAAAGINRLGLKLDKKVIPLEEDIMISSPCQGILGLEIREDDKKIDELLKTISDEKAEIQTKSERAFLKGTGGSCHVPVGAYCKISGDEIHIDGVLGSEDGSKLVRKSISGPVEDAEKLGRELADILNKEISMEKGKVYLIGAGPGDAGLITKKGYEYLKESDVVVYDRLVNKELLADLEEDVRLIYVGKTAQHHTKTQDETNEILYQEAKAGNIVARLKGGDPYVFGRGGEEGEYLFDRNIEFEEVPGITSAIGGLAYAGIPITHRGVATSFHVITGHLQEGSEDLNWNALAQLKGTLVFLMGVGNLENITNNLMKEGKDPETKAAIINWGTTTRQKVVEGKLSNIYEVAVKANIKPPSLIVIGDVVSLREKLKFHERKPLFGKNIVITRERKSALSTIEKFKALGANVISFPTIKTVPIENNKKLYSELDNLKNYEYLVFTSVNGVDIFFNELFEKGLDTRALGDVKIAAVGPKTGDSMKKYGIVSDIIPDKYVAEELIDVLKPILKKEDRVLIPRAKIARPKLVEELEELSLITEVEIYETIKDDDIQMDILEEIEELEDYYLVYTSSSTFTNFKEILGEDNKSIIEKGKIISIGPITTKTVEESGYELYKEARDYTIDGIIDILMEEE